MSPRQARIRRFVFYLGIYSIVIFIFLAAHHYYDGNYSHFFLSTKSVSSYNEYIDQNGNYLPYSGYKILQLVSNYVPDKLTELYNYLNRQDELKLYFALVPKARYHVTLVNLKNKILHDDKQLEILKQEQLLLDKDETSTTCTGKSLSIIDKNEIRMEIDLVDSYVQSQLKDYQKRWNEKFPELILEPYTSFYVTVAYQYKDIPDKDIFNRLDKLLKEWIQLPINLELDPLEICSYTNLINHTPVTPDIITEV